MKCMKCRIPIDHVSLKVSFGVFTIDQYMGITFEDDYYPGLDYLWRAHGSLLNENGYVTLWQSWQKFCDENEYTPGIGFIQFRLLMIRLFKAYEILKA